MDCTCTSRHQYTYPLDGGHNAGDDGRTSGDGTGEGGGASGAVGAGGGAAGTGNPRSWYRELHDLRFANTGDCSASSGDSDVDRGNNGRRNLVLVTAGVAIQVARVTRGENCGSLSVGDNTDSGEGAGAGSGDVGNKGVGEEEPGRGGSDAVSAPALVRNTIPGVMQRQRRQRRRWR
jgi:hypothetical protein